MGHLSYNKVGNGARRSCHGRRGFKLNPKRFSVQRLRTRFLCFFKLLHRLRSSYGRALKSLKKCLPRRNSIKRNNSSGSSTKSLVVELPNTGKSDSRLRSFGRSNSFYAEAIADCLEFIKRSSVSID
ncbi:hypothetical protein CJ030_MR7G000113 [Morella rubra]|uniref:Uncharacterized protein n=1 Tax=Morella rubra TaxID=262757 RepID=A0A6A1V1G9_9ROSI|nr:hypothetical protein CJ030_MR7G000113 [Morella rubra]